MKNKIIAEIICSPHGGGISVSKYVKAAVKALEAYEEIRVIHTPMSSIFEADTMDQVLEATKRAHEAIFDTGIQRVVTSLRIDDRRDKPRVMEDKLRAIEK
ncbi:MAG: MTH1187 family thiamine-binding protein [Candidatus Heimdallarchaeota archaeon]|nr:MTH1187 family thiamine-binding protein [Candidatus Heimdallarchaeota archaeon]